MAVSSVETDVHGMSDSAIGIKEQEEVGDSVKAPTYDPVDPDRVLEEAKKQLAEEKARENERRAKEAVNYLSDTGAHYANQPLLKPKDFIQRKIDAVRKFLWAPTSEEIHQD